MDRLFAIFIDGVLKGQKSGPCGEISVGSDVTRKSRLFRCPDDKIRHPGHYGRFSSDFYVMAFRTDPLMNLSVKRKTEGFFGTSDKETEVVF
ncbi:hypothetical protein [Desulfonema magnum]|uniref:hypothetical protein n=1 Tax=Desulfonema magnum TaxID=45655 RepID=UPI001A9B9FCD|nr:hypothetical protein [Desulfonema magnum]